MTTLGPRLRKGVLVAHLVSSVGWIGAVFGYLALGAAAVISSEAMTVRAAWIGMELTGWFVLAPLALTALVSGVVLSLGTAWGLARHYWTLIALVLTVLSTVVMLLHMPDVSALAAVARTADPTELAELGGDQVHPAIGLLILLVITVLNVYKPRGVTRYGWRKQREQRAAALRT